MIRTNGKRSMWVVMALMLPAAVFAQSRFDGSEAPDRSWSTANNWTPAVVPVASNNVYIGTTNVLGAAGNNVTATIGAGESAVSKALYVGAETPGSMGTLNMTGGTLAVLNSIVVAGQSVTTGAFCQTAGRVTAAGVSMATAPYSVATVLLAGDSALTGSLTMASSPYAQATLILSNSVCWTAPNSTTFGTVGSAGSAKGSILVRDSAVMQLHNGGARNLNLGSAAGGTGCLEVVNGGAVTNFGTLTVGGLGYGSLLVGGRGTVRGTMIDVCMTNNDSWLTACQTGLVAGLYRVGGASGAHGTVTLSDNAQASIYNGAEGMRLGAASGAVGRLLVDGSAALNLRPITTGRRLDVGSTAGATGIVELTGSGAITGAASIFVGVSGQGAMSVGGSAKVDVDSIYLGSAAGSNAVLTVTDSGYVASSVSFQMGMTNGNVSRLDVLGGTVRGWGTAAGIVSIGHVAGSTGIVTVSGGQLILGQSTTAGSANEYVGNGVGSLGCIVVTGGGILDMANTARASSTTWLLGVAGRAEIVVEGGVYANTRATSLGTAAGGVGDIRVSGGSWYQSGALTLGSAAGGTGLVTVANTVQTNITGAVTVGLAGCGLLAVSNATLGFTGNLTVDGGTNAIGVVTLAGTQRLFKVGGIVTIGDAGRIENRVAGNAGGLELSRTNANTLAVAAGGLIHVVFAQDPVVTGHHWGLRWAGSHVADLEALRSAGRLNWDSTGLSDYFKEKYPVGIYSADGYTYVGFNATGLPAAADGIAVLVE